MDERELQKFGEYVRARISATNKYYNTFSARFREDAITSELLYQVIHSRPGRGHTQILHVRKDPSVSSGLNTESVTGADFLWEIHDSSHTRLESIQGKKILTLSKTVSVDHSVVWQKKPLRRTARQSERLMSYASQHGFKPYYLFYLDPIELNFDTDPYYRYYFDNKQKHLLSNCSMLIADATLLCKGGWPSRMKGKDLRKKLTDTKVHAKTLRAHLFDRTADDNSTHVNPVPPTPSSLDENQKSNDRDKNQIVEDKRVMDRRGAQEDEIIELDFKEFDEWLSQEKNSRYWLNRPWSLQMRNTLKQFFETDGTDSITVLYTEI